MYKNLLIGVLLIAAIAGGAYWWTNQGATQAPESNTITGEYTFSDMTGNAYLYAPSAIAVGKKTRYTLVEEAARTQIIGNMHSLSDSCNLSVEVVVEIEDPKFIKHNDRDNIDEYDATFVRLVSKGKVYNDCASDGTTSRTEYKKPVTQPNTTTSNSLPTSCVDGEVFESAAVITYMSHTSGPVGTKLEVRGCNFAGFESDKNLWIENAQGVKGILYGEREPSSPTYSKVVKVTLESKLCTHDTSYSGLPCNSYLTLTPGVYKLWSSPGNEKTKSNVVTFTIL